MNELTVVEKIAEWQRLKALVLDSVSSPSTRRVYKALDEFMAWFLQEPLPRRRTGPFTTATEPAPRTLDHTPSVEITSQAKVSH
jgi:hypothetical protein